MGNTNSIAQRLRTAEQEFPAINESPVSLFHEGALEICRLQCRVGRLEGQLHDLQNKAFGLIDALARDFNCDLPHRSDQAYAELVRALPSSGLQATAYPEKRKALAIKRATTVGLSVVGVLAFVALVWGGA